MAMLWQAWLQRYVQQQDLAFGPCLDRVQMLGVQFLVLSAQHLTAKISLQDM